MERLQLRTIISSVIAFFVALFVLPLIWLIYVSEFEETVIKTVTFGDSGYELTIREIGDPGWPFGPDRCRLDFKQGREMVSALRIGVSNDGAPARSGNFRVHWFTDFVRVVVRAEEQPMTLYDLYYDGTTEETVLWSAERTKELTDAREKVAKILDLELPSDGCDSIGKDTYSPYHSCGKAIFSVDFHGSNTVQEQIGAKGTWHPLPMPEEFRSLAAEIGVDWGGDTDEEIGEGYWFFLDRHEDAADHYDFYAALNREEMHCIAAVYSEQYQSLILLQYDSRNE